jgi:hypothetical protein
MAVTFNPFTGNLDFVNPAPALGDLTDVDLQSVAPEDGEALIYDDATGTWIAGTAAAGAAGNDTEIQYNDNGTLAGDADLTWDTSGATSVLGVGGDINLDDGGANTLTLQTVTPTAARTISFPDATGTVGLVAGSSGQLVFNDAGAYAGVSTATVSSGNITLTGRFISSLNGALSATGIAGVPAAVTGTWITGGTATTTKPLVLIEPTGATSTAWSTSGTGLGVNAASGFAGNLLDLQVNGTRSLSVLDSSGSGASIKMGPDGSIVCDKAGGTNKLGLFHTAGTEGIEIRNTWGVGIRGLQLSIGAAGGSPDTYLFRDAAHIFAQRNAANAQTLRVYDTYTSATDFHRVAIATARATLTNVSGASVTATGLIPAGAVVMGVTSKVTTALGTTNSTTGYKIGTGADDDRWGAITGTAAGTTSDNRNWTAGTIECFPTATDVIVTATGGNFDATGVIYLSVQYMAGEAD